MGRERILYHQGSRKEILKAVVSCELVLVLRDMDHELELPPR